MVVSIYAMLTTYGENRNVSGLNQMRSNPLDGPSYSSESTFNG